jgi:hypothetical protein
MAGRVARAVNPIRSATVSSLTPAEPVHPTAAPGASEADHPGRWLGGLVGAAASLAAAVVLLAAEGPFEDQSPSLVGGPTANVALLGIPIAFALGRAAFPSVRSGGWRWALVAGVLIGLAAPPLGALEVVLGPLLLPLDPAASNQVLLVTFLPVAVVFSYAVAWITIPVGLVAAIGIRALPASLPERLRAPRVLAVLGVRHACLALAVWAIVVQIGTPVIRG